MASANTWVREYHLGIGKSQRFRIVVIFAPPGMIEATEDMTLSSTVREGTSVNAARTRKARLGLISFMSAGRTKPRLRNAVVLASTFSKGSSV